MALITPRRRTQLTEEIAQRYDLAVERIMQLEESRLYPQVMNAAHKSSWMIVQQLLEEIQTAADL